MAFVVAINGTVDTTTINVIDILYFNHQVYYEDVFGSWYLRNPTTKTWSAIPVDPRTVTNHILTTSGRILIGNGLVLSHV